jgi:Ca2+-binding EF-hand superfamily protein
MLIRIEKDLDAAESKIGDRLHLLDTDNDGVISRAELQDAFKFLQDELSEDEMQQLLKMLGDTEKISVSKLEELRSNVREDSDAAATTS